MVWPLWKTVWWFLPKLKILLPYNPAIMVFGIYSELKTVSTQNLHAIFTETLFIMVKTWKQSRHPSVGEWINKLWYIRTMEYHPVLKRNKLSSCEKTWKKVLNAFGRKHFFQKQWKKLKCILLSERSQSERVTYCMIPTR